MQMNVKSIFFVATLLFLIVGVSAISATNLSDDTTVLKDTSDNMAPIVATPSNDNSIKTTKNLKTDKNIKTATETVEVNNYTELTTAINNAVNDTENNEYIINLNEGTYQLTTWQNLNPGTNTPNIIINGNNQILTSSSSSSFLRFQNGCNYTIKNVTINHVINDENCGLTLKNVTLNSTINVYGGSLTIDDDVIFGEKTSILISNNGQLITNDTNKVVLYLKNFNDTYVIENGVLPFGGRTNYGTLTIKNATITSPNGSEFTNYGELTIIDSYITAPLYNGGGKITIINSTINNRINNIIYNNVVGEIILSDDVVFGENFMINGEPNIVYNNTEKLLPYIPTYSGNYTLNNLTIIQQKTNNGNLTLNNTTVDASITNNGNLIIDNSTLNKWITNNGNLTLGDNLTFGGSFGIDGTGIVITENLSKVIPYMTTFYKEGIVSIENSTILKNYGNLTIENSTINKQFTNNQESQLTFNNCTINFMPINYGTMILSDTTLNTSIENTGELIISDDTILTDNVKFIINNEGSYTNVTGIYFHNTQLWLYNTHNVILDNISAVVEDQRVGSGVGQTSIRANSSNITVKNSYFYTRNNGGSSTLVLAWADNCTIENNTIEGDGNVGNMLYITTYNVEIPTDIVFNSHNKLINNTIRGPEEAAGICIGICYCGIDNLIDGNTITYSGTGISEQWGSGINGIETNESAFNNSDNIVSNNKLYGGCGIISGDIIYNNYMEGQLSAPKLAYNNIASSAYITSSTTELINNTINGPVTMVNNINSSKIINNTINGNIDIPQRNTNITITGNNITGNITLEGSKNIITNNIIIADSQYTISGKKATENIITDNYLMAKTLIGDKSVNLNVQTNTIENNMPYENILKVDTTEFTIGQTATITASIYYNKEINTTINKGKVAFKINGKTLKDTTTGKVIYAKVVNGKATIENYLVPDTWNKNNITIEAVYSGSTQCDQLRSEKTPITINKAQPTFTTEDITTTVGSTINLTATITDGNKVINNGKVVFKINGKTIKDTNGKVIYAKVSDNQVSVTYTLPADMKTKQYNLTATFISSEYDRLEDTKTLTVN